MELAGYLAFFPDGLDEFDEDTPVNPLAIVALGLWVLFLDRPAEPAL